MTSQATAITVMENCISDIRKWMRQNKLKMNDTKTEFIFIGTRHQLKKLKVDSISIGGSRVQCADSVRNLGVWFDKHLSLEKHINLKCKIAHYQLYNLRKIKQYLSRQSLEILVHGLVQSHIDYCNSLFTGIPKHLLSKLKKHSK